MAVMIFGARRADACLMYEHGTYEFALECFEQAKLWVILNALDKDSRIHTIVYPPELKGVSPYYEKFVPEELLSNPDWYCAVEFYCVATSDVSRLKKLETPTHSWFSVLNSRV